MFIADKTRPVIERIADMESFGANDVDASNPAVTYMGKEDRDGKWTLQKIDTSTTDVKVIRYASVKNNPTITGYNDAWTNKATLIYEIFSLVIG